MMKILKKIIKAVFDPIIGEIIMLHSVTQHREKIPTEKQRYSITPDYLENLINDYRSKNYRFITLDEVEQIVKKKIKTKDKVVCFTFDDGYFDNLYEAYPIFKQYECPFAIYISTHYSMLDKNDLLTEQQIYKLSQESLCTIGAHTKSHFHLPAISETLCRNEILENKLFLEKITNKSIKHFSYPYGEYSEKVITVLKELGFHTATCAWGGGFRISSNPFLIPRKEVSQIYDKK